MVVSRDGYRTPQVVLLYGDDGWVEHVDNGIRYHKIPKFSDARKHCCNLPKIQTKMPNHREFHQKSANGIAHSEDSDQTALWVCTVCPNLYVQKLKINTVSTVLLRWIFGDN